MVSLFLPPTLCWYTSKGFCDRKAEFANVFVSTSCTSRNSESSCSSNPQSYVEASHSPCAIRSPRSPMALNYLGLRNGVICKLHNSIWKQNSQGALSALSHCSRKALHTNLTLFYYTSYNACSVSSSRYGLLLSRGSSCSS